MNKSDDKTIKNESKNIMKKADKKTDKRSKKNKAEKEEKTVQEKEVKQADNETEIDYFEYMADKVLNPLSNSHFIAIPSDVYNIDGITANELILYGYIVQQANLARKPIVTIFKSDLSDNFSCMSKSTINRAFKGLISKGLIDKRNMHKSGLGIVLIPTKNMHIGQVKADGTIERLSVQNEPIKAVIGSNRTHKHVYRFKMNPKEKSEEKKHNFIGSNRTDKGTYGVNLNPKGRLRVQNEPINENKLYGVNLNPKMIDFDTIKNFTPFIPRELDIKTLMCTGPEERARTISECYTRKPSNFEFTLRHLMGDKDNWHANFSDTVMFLFKAGLIFFKHRHVIDIWPYHPYIMYSYDMEKIIPVAHYFLTHQPSEITMFLEKCKEINKGKPSDQIWDNTQKILAGMIKYTAEDKAQLTEDGKLKKYIPTYPEYEERLKMEALERQEAKSAAAKYIKRFKDTIKQRDEQEHQEKDEAQDNRLKYNGKVIEQAQDTPEFHKHYNAAFGYVRRNNKDLELQELIDKSKSLALTNYLKEYRFDDDTKTSIALNQTVTTPIAAPATVPNIEQKGAKETQATV